MFTFISAFSPRIPAICCRRTAKWARIYAEASAGLQIDIAYMRGALHGCKLTSHICGTVLHDCFTVAHICGADFTLRRGRCRPVRCRRRPASCPCWRWGSSWHVCGSIRGLRSCVSQGRRPRARRGSSQRKR